MGEAESPGVGTGSGQEWMLILHVESSHPSSAVTPQRCLLKLFLSLPRSQCRIPEGRREQGRKQERDCVWGRKAEYLGKEKGGPLWVESYPPERCVEILTPDACECDPIGNRDFTDVVRLR